MHRFSRSLLFATLLGSVWLAGGTPKVRGAEDPLAAVAEHVRAGQPHAALHALAELPSEVRKQPAAHYLRGRMLAQMGRYRGAAGALQRVRLGELPGAVRRDARFRLAMLRARTGDCGRARRTLGSIARRGGPRAQVARAVAAECAVRLGKLKRAAKELRAVARVNAERVDTFAVRMQLAEALSERGLAEAAQHALHDLLVDRPEHPDVAHARAQYRERTGHWPTFSQDDRMHRARRLMRFAEYDEAAAELDGEPPATRRPRARWLHLRGMALYQTRKHYAEAARLLRRAARIGGPHAIDDEFHAARALSRADRDDQAIDDYRELLGDHPRHPRAAQAEFLAAWLELHHGQRSGEWHMERFVEGPRGRRSPSRRRQGVWHLGLRAYERQRFSRAAEMFERYAHMGSGPMVQARGAYWLGRTRQSAGDRDAAAESYRRAMQVQPLHWYALLARQRLVELGEDPGPPFGGEPETKASPPEPLEPTLPPGPALYARLGFRGDAVRALRRQERPVRAAAPQGRELEALVTAYQRLGVAERPYRLVVVRHRGVLGERPSPTNRWIWQAAYPRPWPEAARAAAASRGLRPELLYAIMRQESSYDPDVVSYAGAVGLMQVMPATAQKLADRHGIEVRRDMLFLPDWNLRFGATYVDQLLQQLEGQVPLAVAAFNAGAANVRSWLDERGELPLDHFVERIPFDQTRNYVRHVISHYARYRYLDDPDAGWPFELTMKLPVSSP